MNEEKDQLTDHDYDGIQEYNNPLPSWWLWTFLGTIIFAFIYYIHYELGGAPSLDEDLSRAMAVISAKQEAITKSAAVSPEDFDTQIKNADLAAARGHILGKCAACHGNDLQGGIGPNLVDAYWLHGKGTAQEIATVVKSGIIDKGMPAWSAVLNDSDVVAVTAYILSKQDSNPAGAKAPQGEKVR